MPPAIENLEMHRESCIEFSRLCMKVPNENVNEVTKGYLGNLLLGDGFGRNRCCVCCCGHSIRVKQSFVVGGERNACWLLYLLEPLGYISLKLK